MLPCRYLCTKSDLFKGVCSWRWAGKLLQGVWCRHPAGRVWWEGHQIWRQSNRRKAIWVWHCSVTLWSHQITGYPKIHTIFNGVLRYNVHLVLWTQNLALNKASAVVLKIGSWSMGGLGGSIMETSECLANMVFLYCNIDHRNKHNQWNILMLLAYHVCWCWSLRALQLLLVTSWADLPPSGQWNQTDPRWRGLVPPLP